MEVPFIWTYRRDYLHPSITNRHLWKMMDLDETWVRLIAIRMRLENIHEAVTKAAEATAETKREWVSKFHLKVFVAAMWARILLLVCIASLCYFYIFEEA